MSLDQITLDQIINSIIAFWTFIAACASAISAYMSKKTNDELNKRYFGGLISFVFPDGTFLFKNETGEELELEVKQLILAEDLISKNDKDSLKDIEIKIETGKLKEISDSLNKEGKIKCSKINLSLHEEFQIPDCMMYGYRAEDIKQVIIATLVTYKGAHRSQINKIYIHRFTMGEGVPEPRARWAQISSIKL